MSDDSKGMIRYEKPLFNRPIMNFIDTLNAETLKPV
jgi:hypothetical protein